MHQPSPADFRGAQVVRQDDAHDRPARAPCADRGSVVQTFKKGPDYIDPMWLARASGRPCFNLDSHLMDDGEIVRCFARSALRGADLALVEGNKGLYDGLALDGSNSNAALAGCSACRCCW